MACGCPPVHDNPFHERFFLFLTTFGILNIIVGVIVENTLNAAKQNMELQASCGRLCSKLLSKACGVLSPSRAQERRLQRQLRQEPAKV